MSEAGVRVAAIVVAVGLVGGALVLRGRIDDEGGSGNNDGGGDAPAQTLVCPPELEDACRTLAGDFEIITQDALTTGDALTGARRADEVEGDLWLTTTPWVEAVDLTRENLNDDPVLGPASEVIARSPIVLVVRDDRAAVFEAACGGTIDWLCLGTFADQQSAAAGGDPNLGTVRVGMTDPTTAAGLPVLGNATAGILETTDYATNDLDGGDVSNRLRGIASGLSNAGGGNPVNDLLTRGAGIYWAVGALEVDARVAADRPDARVIVPDPLGTADLVVVPIGDTDPDDASDVAGDDALLAALAEDGWRVPGQDAAAGVAAGPDLPRRQGFPNGAVLRAVLTRWLDL